MKFVQNLMTVAKAYCTATNRSLSRVSTIVFNDGSKLKAIEGGASLTVRKWEDAMQWFSDNWPDGVDWPEGVERPPATERLGEGAPPAPTERAGFEA